MITSLFYYPHGLTAALSADGNQDAAESVPWYLTYLRWLASIGLADDRTLVHVPASFSGPAAHLRNSHLSVGPAWPSPVAPAGSPLSNVYFTVKGEAMAFDLVGSRHPPAEAYWFQPDVEDKLRRGVIDASARITVPNVYVGSVGHFLGQVPALAWPGG